MRTRKLNKDRVFRHMAKDASDEIRFFLDRDELIDKIGYDVPWSQTGDLVSEYLHEKYLKNWLRLMALKHENFEIVIRTFQDFDIDYNRYRFGAYVRQVDVRC